MFLLLPLWAEAGNIEDIRQALLQSSLSQVQEKVYLHTDNQCYFVGDTLWYKAYVVRADNLKPTDLSRILYVELLSPDGLLVERQQIVVNPKGYTCGQFVLTDSLYSGYYEMRAYTRWMLNFNVRHHQYSTQDAWWFYNKDMAADYFRVWDGLYSRVLPVYSKPEKAGDYDVRTMYQRPKTRLPRKKKDDLVVTFYPEGGHLIDGVENRVAFEVCDQFGEAVDVKGTVSDGSQSIDIQTEYMGRGSFVVTPKGQRLKATFQWRDKKWSELLPKEEAQGVALRLDNNRLTINAAGLPQDKEYAVSILCRGSLQHFEQVSLSGQTVVTLPLENLPSGVADVTLFDSDGHILADRLCFVNNHEHDEALITAPIVKDKTYSPYERIELPVQLNGVEGPTTFSLSIYDAYSDGPSYDNGNILTDLLLSSELKGFIAYPAHYFESDDELHRHHLDLLMMVQGWRKYKWEELAGNHHQLRYKPETGLTVEGAVYQTPSFNELELIEAKLMPFNVAFKRYKDTLNNETLYGSELLCEYLAGNPEFNFLSDASNIAASDFVFDWIQNTDDNLGTNHKPVSKEVLVEAEVAVGKDFAGSTQKTKDGRFLFGVPPFYGYAYLKMKAYKENDSIKKNMASLKDKKMLDETAYPDYYVKRDLFYPMYTKEYTYYQKHQPDVAYEELFDTLSDWTMENDVHQLNNVNVKGHRRGRRAVDWSKPAFMTDAYDLYNDLTDYGLSHGMLNMRLFPIQVSRFLFGNMNRKVSYNIDGRLEGLTFYRNYCPVPQPYPNISGDELIILYAQMQQYILKRAPQDILDDLKLKRMSDIRIYTDYEHRYEDSTLVAETYTADVIVDLVPFANDAVQPTFRDRHIVLQGFNMAENFYSPDYSRRRPTDLPADYRRTLYWNPNAVTDDDGSFTATFYNNGKETRIRMSAAGIDSEGRLLHSK